jgi:hypothetical protein
MARFSSGKNGNIDLPDRRRKVPGIALRLIPLLPAEETRFMLPHIEGVRQYGLILHPDDLLVNQNTAITHGFLYLNLTLRGVPDVNRSISLAYGECLSQERFIERSKRFGLLLVGIAALPVLVLAVGEVLRRMVLRVIGD